MTGIFDSGIGGLTVVRALLRQAPRASFVYLGDTARTPYGNKSAETIQRYAGEDAAFLRSQGAESIVVACNTVSAIGLDGLTGPDTHGKIFEVITPAVEDALAVTRGVVGIIGTRATVGSGAYQKLLGAADPTLQIEAIACPLFAPLVEEGWLSGDAIDEIVGSYLEQLRITGVDTMILGCTHYPLLKESIQKFMGSGVRLVDSAESVVRRLVQSNVLEDGAQGYFLTDLSARSSEIAEAWLGAKVDFQKAELVSLG